MKFLKFRWNGTTFNPEIREYLSRLTEIDCRLLTGFLTKLITHSKAEKPQKEIK